MNNTNKNINLIIFIALLLATAGTILSAYNNIVQSNQIDELRSRIDIMEVYFPVEIPDRSWK